MIRCIAFDWYIAWGSPGVLSYLDNLEDLAAAGTRPRLSSVLITKLQVPKLTSSFSIQSYKTLLTTQLTITHTVRPRT